MGTGPLHRPKLPGIPGIETFAGHSFHTSRWDYDYTGGDPDRRAARPVWPTSGSASSAPAPRRCSASRTWPAGAQELYVFQRTPSSIDVRNNHEIDPDWFAELEPGWQQKWLINFATLQTGGFADEDLVKDGWTDISQRIRDRVIAEMSEPGARVRAGDHPARRSRRATTRR